MYLVLGLKNNNNQRQNKSKFAVLTEYNYGTKSDESYTLDDTERCPSKVTIYVKMSTIIRKVLFANLTDEPYYEGYS